MESELTKSCEVIRDTFRENGYECDCEEIIVGRWYLRVTLSNTRRLLDEELRKKMTTEIRDKLQASYIEILCPREDGRHDVLIVTEEQRCNSRKLA